MLAKPQEKELAIKLRQKGLSYSEILKLVPVSQATLSLWLRSIRLGDEAKKRLVRIQHEGIMRGANRKKDARMSLEKVIRENAANDIGKLSRQTLLLAGAALYWAEGSKQKPHAVSVGVIFSNSDPEMVRFFYKWLVDICHVNPDDIRYELYIHKTGNVAKAEEFWRIILPTLKGGILSVRLKKNNSHSFRKNRGENYHGVIRLKVNKSTNLNRKIMGWAEALCKKFSTYSEVV